MNHFFPTAALALLALAPLSLPLMRAHAGDSDTDRSVPVRVGEHPGFSRIVFDLAARVSWKLGRDGEQVTLHFDPPNTVAALPWLPHNVIGMTPDADGVELTIVHGARLRTMRLRNWLVLDVLDPVSAAASTPLRMPPAAKVVQTALPLDRHDVPPVEAAATVASLPQAVPSAVPATPPATPAAPPTVQPTAGEGAPVSLAATKVAGPPGGQASATLFPFGRTAGAAAFRRGRHAVLVFDEARPLDLGALRDDPVFGSAVVHELPAATMVLLPLTPVAEVALRHEPEGWRVTVGAARAPAQAFTSEVRDGALIFPVREPGRVVSIVDPESGGTLLVGTEVDSGPAVPVRHEAPQFVLWPTWQGIAVEPLSERLTLQILPAGFALGLEGGGPLSITPTNAETAALANAVGLTQRFDLPEMPASALADRLRQQVAEAAAAAPLSRGGLLTGAATTMIALGWGPEAAATIRLAALATPQETEDPTEAGLAAVAALLAWRPEQAEAIDDARLSGSDEVTLWRAVRDAELRVAAPRAASEFAATWPLILTYRQPLRDRLLPLAAETMVAGGAKEQARALLSGSPNDPSLALARGMLAQADGQIDAALAIYDALSVAKDRLLRVRGAQRAIDVRLASGRITEEQAADQLENLLVAWKGDERELSLRERLAELRAQAGHWRTALELLRGTGQDFPDCAAEVHERMRHTFTAALRDARFDALPPLEFIALVDENTDLIPPGADRDALAARLADRLLALDLPEQAEPVLRKLVHVALPGAGRAGIGARLAALRLRRGDAGGAISALADSSADGLPAELTETRTLLLAEAESRNGDVQNAVAALSELGTAAADEKRATILERAQNWAGAESALKDYAAKTVPEGGNLDDAQRRALIRLATATARSGDQAGLEALRRANESRMGTGPLADMFRLLTADPVHGVADLRRSGQEAALAHALPEDLKAVR